MEWTESLECGARPLEGKITADHLHDVICGGYLLNDVFGDQSHGVGTLECSTLHAQCREIVLGIESSGEGGLEVCVFALHPFWKGGDLLQRIALSVLLFELRVWYMGFVCML